jgi:alkaline phosphatase D
MRTNNSNANYLPPTPGEHYHDFHYEDVAFFVMDTRHYHSRTDDDVTTCTMLGDAQLATLHAWLSRVNETSRFNFIGSSP